MLRRPRPGLTDPDDDNGVKADHSAVGLRSGRGPVLVALMLSISLIAVDATVLATAVPSIVGQIGGFSQFPWLFSIFLLTQAVSTPLYGRFCDMVGRRPVLFFGIALFLLGSVFCGIAWSMPVLIAARAVQGLGAGAILPVSMTIVADSYTLEERARVQGYLASVWGIAAVLGPALGGLFSQYWSWRWLFFINLPLGLLAFWMLARHFTERIEPRPQRVDYAGVVVLTAGCSLLIVGLLEGGVSWSWGSPVGVAVLGSSLILLSAFVVIEWHAADPVIPLWIFRQRLLVSANLTSFCVGALLFGLTSYVPAFVQGVLGTGALVAGFVLATMTIGWPLAATLSGRIYLRIGFRDTALIGSVVVFGGSLLFLWLGLGSWVWLVALGCFVVGVGLGLTSSPTLVGLQASVDWRRRGVVTGTNLFARSIGSSVGAAVFGAVANTSLAARFAHPPAELAGRLPSGLDATALVLTGSGGSASGGSGSGSSGVDPRADQVADFVRAALSQAAHHVFVGVALVGAALILTVSLMPRRAVVFIEPEPARAEREPDQERSSKPS